ncbi:MAG: DUF2490 domain-containing protein [Flavobacteriales bacterium]|nr:DUF2490 domain-containing protein [Flavobacteriales bacterium]
MTSLKRLILLLLIVLPFSGMSQYSDVGLWLQGSVSQEVVKDLSWEIEGACRLNDYATSPGSIFTDIGAKYKFSKYFRIAGTYRYGIKLQDEGYFRPRQRFALDLSSKQDIREIELGYRFRFQASPQVGGSEGSAVEFDNSMRHRISLETKLKKRTWIQVSGEIYTGREDDQLMPTDMRLKVGIDKRLKKRKYLSYGFIFNSEINNDDPLREYVAFVSYSLELKKIKLKKKEEATTP